MQDSAPQNPFFRPIPRQFKTEDELNQPIDCLIVSVYGQYTTRGEHRKEVIEKHYEAEIEVPANFNKGHVKLGVNRYVRKKLHGIRARTFHVNDEVEPKKAEHRRRVRDFMSDKGIRDNERAKKEYMREMKKRKEEAEQMAADGMMPFDQTEYGPDGLPKFSDKTYIA